MICSRTFEQIVFTSCIIDVCMLVGVGIFPPIHLVQELMTTLLALAVSFTDQSTK